MLRGDLEGEELERFVEQRVMTTTVDKAVSWAQGNSIYPLTFGLACCAIEMMSIVAARVDIARFGFEAFRASPRQADLIILSGRVSIKMAPVIRRIYDQMLEPKWAISMGACCSSMGVFNNYALVPSDKFMPIDVHVPGCPPRPEALMHGILRLRDKIQGHPPRRLARALRRGRHRGGPPRRDRARTTPHINVFKPGRHRRCLTRPALELTAQELRDADSESILDTEFQRGRAVLSRQPGTARRRARAPARTRATRSSPACTASTTTPTSRGSACSTSCSTCTRVDRITSRRACRTEEPRVPTR